MPPAVLQTLPETLAEGKDVPGWDGKTEEQKKRLQSRADDYKKLGPFKDRKNGNRGGNRGGGANGASALLALLSSLPGANLIKVPSNIASAIQTHGDTIAQRVIIDTGNLTGMHLISNKSLFSGDINQNVTAASFAVAN